AEGSRRGPGGVPSAPARRGPGPERRVLPGRRGPGRGPHPRSHPLTGYGRWWRVASPAACSLSIQMRLLKRKLEHFDVPVQDLLLRVTGPDYLYEDVSAAGMLFWEHIQSYAIRNPAFRTSK